MTHLADLTVLVPAAGRVPEGVLALSNVTCPAMIPVAGRPVIQWTLGYLDGLGVRRARIAVAERGGYVEEFVDCLFGDRWDIEFLTPERDAGPGGTILELAEAAPEGPVLVVLGDTHFELADPAVLGSADPVVLVDEVEESYRWCVAEVADDGTLGTLHDKEPGLPAPQLALVGVYLFPDVGMLRKAAHDVAQRNDRIEVADVLDAMAAEVPIHVERAGTWLDCGNPDRQAAAQRVLLEQRAFNELHVDEVFGTITKRSRHRAKFVDEINYLRLLPPDLAVLFPRVLEHSVRWDDPFVTLEFYGYPTLAELFVFENVDTAIWHRILVHLHRILTDGFGAHEHPVEHRDVVEMLLGKVLRRLDDLTGPPELLELVRREDPLLLDGHPVAPLAALRPRLEHEVDRLAGTAHGTAVHGDLCFSNVLYDLRSGICKLIDPRGSFGQAGIYGDPRYDVAKLYHSVHGRYDFITADLFHVEVAGDEAHLGIRSRPYHDQIRQVFDDVFLADPAERRDVLLVTGLIFLSLPALHYDRPARQLALHLRGLQLLDEALGLAG